MSKKINWRTIYNNYRTDQQQLLSKNKSIFLQQIQTDPQVQTKYPLPKITKHIMYNSYTKSSNQAMNKSDKKLVANSSNNLFASKNKLTGWIYKSDPKFDKQIA